MTGHDDFDRTLAGWFEADARSAAPAGGVDRVLDVTRRRRPRPAWLAGPGSHWVGQAGYDGSSSGARTVPRLGPRWSTALIVLLVIAALVGGAILVGALLVQPSPLPTGRLGHLAYGLDGDIYVADWDGRNPVRIADGPPGGGKSGCFPVDYWGEGSMWSPDGRHLAYRSGLDQGSCPQSPGGTVMISDPEGHPVASFPGTGWLISWSPDSTRVATWVDMDRTIGISGLDGVRQALLTLPPGFGVYADYDPAWSPDGSSLLIPLRPDPGADPRQIWEIPVDGRTPRPVPADDPRSLAAAFSSDGARVAYVADGGLVVAAADGSQARVVVPVPPETVFPCGSCIPRGWGTPPVWSPTGDRIAFAIEPGGGMTVRGPETELRLVDVASGTVTSLAGSGGTETVKLIRFSPEGDRILFSRTESSGSLSSTPSASTTTNDMTSLWSVRADGSDAQLLVKGIGWGDWQQLPAGP